MEGFDGLQTVAFPIDGGFENIDFNGVDNGFVYNPKINSERRFLIKGFATYVIGEMIVTGKFGISPKNRRIEVGKIVNGEILHLKIIKLIRFNIVSCKRIVGFVMAVRVNQLHKFIDRRESVGVCLKGFVTVDILVLGMLGDLKRFRRRKRFRRSDGYDHQMLGHLHAKKDTDHVWILDIGFERQVGRMSEKGKGDAFFIVTRDAQ